MPILNFDGQQYRGTSSDTVLDVLLQAGEKIPFACKTGQCQTCLLHCSKGQLPEKAQSGIRYQLRKSGYFLSCQCPLFQDLKVDSPDERLLCNEAIVEKFKPLSRNVYQLSLLSEQNVGFLPGQYINLSCCEGVMHSYSIANTPNNMKSLELHIQRHPSGELNNWLFDVCQVGQRLKFRGPLGNCFYIPEKQEQNMLLIGQDTGLAPLNSIAQSALEMGHKGKIALYHGGAQFKDLYLYDDLSLMEQTNSSFFYFPCVKNADLEDRARHGNADEVAFRDFRDLSNWRVFIAGDPALVARSKMQALKAGAKPEDIFEEPIELTELKRVPQTMRD